MEKNNKVKLNSIEAFRFFFWAKKNWMFHGFCKLFQKVCSCKTQASIQGASIFRCGM